jgi:hypothetical protein
MQRRTSISTALLGVGIASVATFFYLSVTRNFLTGAVEFGTLLAGSGLLVLLLALGVIDRSAVRRVLVYPRRNELISGAVFTTILAMTAGFAFEFPQFPWPAGVLAGLLITAGTYSALEVRDEGHSGKRRA